MREKLTKRIKNKNCPYRDTIIIVGSGLPIYWCALFHDEKQCIFEGYEHDAGECSYYLFPEDIKLKKIKKIVKGELCDEI